MQVSLVNVAFYFMVVILIGYGVKDVTGPDQPASDARRPVELAISPQRRDPHTSSKKSLDQRHGL